MQWYLYILQYLQNCKGPKEMENTYSQIPMKHSAWIVIGLFKKFRLAQQIFMVFIPKYEHPDFELYNETE